MKTLASISLMSVGVTVYTGLTVAAYIERRYFTNAKRDKDRVPWTGRSRYISPHLFDNHGWKLTRYMSQLSLYGEEEKMNRPPSPT